MEHANREEFGLVEDGAALRRYVTHGDPEAFALVCARYESMVYAACLRVLGSESDAMDAAQDTFVKLARHAGSVRSNVAAWLHAAATGCSVDLVRRRGAARRAEARAAGLNGASTTDPGAGASWREIEPVLDEALAALSASERELLVSVFLCGRSQRDVAAATGVNEGTVSRRMTKALAALRRTLEARGVRAGDVTALALTLGAVPAVVVPGGLLASSSKIALTGAAGRAGVGVGNGVKTLALAAVLGGAVVVTGLVVALPGSVSGSGSSSAGTLASAAALDEGPGRPSRAIGPFVLVSAGERNGFDRGVWIRGERISINHGRTLEGEVVRGFLRIVSRERMGDGSVEFTTIVDGVRPVGLEFHRFTGVREVRIRASFDDVGRIVLEPLTEGVQLGANEPRWFGVRPPVGWDEHGMIPDDAGEDGMLGPWAEAERVPVTIDNREIRFGTERWQAAIYRIIEWERLEGYSRVESIHAGGRNPRLIGTRFRLLIREDESGYTVAYFPPSREMGDLWPTSFEHSEENPVTVVSMRGRP